MVVPGLYGYVSATKWVTELEVTRLRPRRRLWTPRGWSERGPVKLQSRIDVAPRRARASRRATAVIAGVAWHNHVGVAGVEVQIDDGPWQAATLASAISADNWVQWSLPWEATSGLHTPAAARSRRTAAPDLRRGTSAPDGATGWDEMTISVA